MNATQTELLEQAKNNAMMDVRVSMPARIVSFDPSTKTASVEIGLKMVNGDDSYADYPPLVDCPCKFTRGGGFHLVHPYKQGDKGVVLFSDRCFDGWFESGQVAPPMDFRIHSMSDAYFIGGVDCLDDVSPIIDNAMFIGKDDNSAGLKIGLDGSLDFYGSKSTFHHNVFIENELTVSGALKALTKLFIMGKDFILHKHTNVQNGNSSSGGVDES